MRRTRIWHGVRMRTAWAASDPDSPPCPVTLPAAWDDAAASGLAALMPGSGPLALAEVAEGWIRPIASKADRAEANDLAARLHRLLLLRRGAPVAEIWRGRAAEAPGFVLNLAAFHDTALGFDVAAFVEAVGTATTALALAAPRARRLAVAMADLASLLAALGLDYDSDAARDVARCLAALMRAHADAASARFARQAMLTGADWPATPATTVVPGLADAAREARAAGVLGPSHRATTAILAPGPADALLGVAVGGIAPAFSPLDAQGALSPASRAWLRARGMSAEAALAATLAGATPFRTADTAAHAAMHEAVAAYLQQMPAHPAGLQLPAAGRSRRDLPARHGGYTQKVTLGGHRVHLRTGEYADGTLGEVTITLPKDGATARGLMECLAQAISLGLQHGIGLDAFVEQFAGTRFGPAGAVEGDADVARATSPLDYAMRHLAANYLQRRDLPLPEDAACDPPAAPPQLPLALPEAAPRRRPALRVVAG
jgi:hypothetical protein